MPFQKIETIIPGYAVGFKSIVIDNLRGYAYYGTYTYPAKIIKVRLIDFKVTQILTLSGEGEGYITGGVIDDVNGFAYFGCYSFGIDGTITSGRIVKINVADPIFSYVGQVSHSAGSFSQGGVIDVDNNMAYFVASEGTFQSSIVRVDLATFTITGVVTHNPSPNGGQTYAVCIDNTNKFIYAANNVDSPKDNTIKKIRIDYPNFSTVSTLVLDTSERGFISAEIDVTNNLAYFMTSAKIVKINTLTFTKVSTLTLSGVTAGYASIIDNQNNLMYINGGTKITKINTSPSDFSQAESIDLLATEGSSYAAVLDTNTNMGYFGSSTTGGEIVKIDISPNVTLPTAPSLVSLVCGA